jgi:hypothetical protein
MTTTYYGAQVTQQRAGALSPSTDCGPVVRQYFYYLVTSATLAVADLLMWGFIPKGARFFGGSVEVSANGVATVANIGSYTTVAAPVVISAAKFGTLADMTLLTTQAFGETVAKSFGVLQATDMYIGIVTGTAIAPAAATFTGYYDYLP